MKIRDTVIVLLIAAVVINSGIIIWFTTNEVKHIGEATSDTSSEEMEETAEDNMEDIAVGTQDSLDNQMKNQYEMVRTWATSPILVNTARDARDYTMEELYEMWSASADREWDAGEAVGDGELGNDLDPEASEYLETLSELTGTYPEIFITDHRGYAIAANGATGDFDQGPDDWRVFKDDTTGDPVYVKHDPEPGGEGWYKACNDAADGFYIGAVEWDDSAESWGIDLVSQIKDPNSGQYLGQIKAVFNYGKFIRNFVEANNVNVYEIKVADQSGTIVATSETDQTKVNNEDVSLGGLEFYDEIRSGLSYGNSHIMDEDGEHVCIGYAVSGDVNEHVVVVSKTDSEVHGPIDAFVGNLKGDIDDRGNAMGRDILMVGAVLGAVIIGIGAAVIHRKVSRPVKKLTALSEKLSKGEIEGLTVDVKGKDEIGQLGENFQGVLAAFNYLNDELKTKDRQETVEQKAGTRKLSPESARVPPRSS